jgi:hypothetical protein
MRRGMNVILAVVVTCSLVLTLQHSMLAQTKSKQESKLNMRKTKEMTPLKGDQTERKIKTKDDTRSERTQISGVERYKVITQNNLFMPLGSAGEVKREEFVLTGIIGRSAFIQMKDSDKSFYVAEGQNFGNDAKLVRVGENSATIFHEGIKKELELASVAFISQPGSTGGGRTRQRQGNSGNSSKEVGSANRAEKERWSGEEKERRDGGEKQRGDTDWAGKMSIDELHGVRGKIVEHIEGLRAKGVRDPKEYEGALRKMEVVERAMAEREYSNQK